jgi:hypothetical protein
VELHLEQQREQEVLVGVGMDRLLPRPQTGLQTLGVAVEAAVLAKLVAQAAQESSSLNTSPSPITKSSRAAAHGLALPGLLRSST